MKIFGACRNCEREFPLDLVINSPETVGRCPFCGKPLDVEYGALLVEALDALQRVGSQMEAILERTQAVGENLDIDADTVLNPIRESLGARSRESAKRREVRRASQAEDRTGAR